MGTAVENAVSIKRLAEDLAPAYQMKVILSMEWTSLRAMICSRLFIDRCARQAAPSMVEASQSVFGDTPFPTRGFTAAKRSQNHYRKRPYFAVARSPHCRKVPRYVYL